MTTPHPAVVAVAKAICEAYGANPNTPVMPEKASTGTEPKVPLWHDCVPHARHIIRAFLDAEITVTSDMIDAGVKIMRSVSSHSECQTLASDRELMEEILVGALAHAPLCCREVLGDE